MTVTVINTEVQLILQAYKKFQLKKIFTTNNIHNNTVKPVKARQNWKSHDTYAKEQQWPDAEGSGGSCPVLNQGQTPPPIVHHAAVSCGLLTERNLTEGHLFGGQDRSV